MVFLVLGNHEFFGTSRSKGLELAASLETEPQCFGKLHVMNKTQVDLEELNIVLLGCTLHSRIPSNDQLMVQMKISDFQHIEGWKPSNHTFEHEIDVTWLQQEIKHIRADHPHRKIVVITHHAPTIKGTSKPSDAGNPWSSAFATELLVGGQFSEVQCWVSGHTHFCSEFKRGGVWLVGNQRGYVLDGVPLQGRLPKTSQRSFIQRTLGWPAFGAKGFAVEKVINI